MSLPGRSAADSDAAADALANLRALCRALDADGNEAVETSWMLARETDFTLPDACAYVATFVLAEWVGRHGGLPELPAPPA